MQNFEIPTARAATARALSSTPRPRFRDPRGQKRRPFHAEPWGSKSARLLCLEYAPATVSRPWRPKVTTLPRKNARVQNRVPLPPEPSRARPCHGFAPLETKVTTLSRKTAGVQKRAPLPPEPSKVRPHHSFATSRPKATSLPRRTAGVQKRAPLEAKSDDRSTQNPEIPKARAATARAL